jgi:hypothetical protein
MYRQGDILVIRSQIPRDAKPLAHRIVAHGELTGHHHQLDENATLLAWRDKLYIVADQDAALTHEEHATIIIPQGTYRVIRQREYDEGHIRYVRD